MSMSDKIPYHIRFNGFDYFKIHGTSYVRGEVIEVVEKPQDTGLLERMARLLKDFSRNYDCDNDAHRYGKACRTCEAEKMLAEYEAQKANRKFTS